MTSPLSRRRFLGAGAASAAGLVLTACNLDRASSPKRQEGAKGWSGSLVDPPLAKPDVTLETLDGKPFNLRTDTAGKLTFLFFGFTNCPDQCPIYLNSLATAKEAITGPGSRPQVLFVGVDLARDTPEAMKRFIDANDPSFIGLTGTMENINAANDALFFPQIVIGEPDEDGNYEVGHYGRGVAFTPDDQGHRLYGYDTRAEQFVADLPRLAEGEWK